MSSAARTIIVFLSIQFTCFLIGAALAGKVVSGESLASYREFSGAARNARFWEVWAYAEWGWALSIFSFGWAGLAWSRQEVHAGEAALRQGDLLSGIVLTLVLVSVTGWVLIQWLGWWGLSPF